MEGHLAVAVKGQALPEDPDLSFDPQPVRVVVVPRSVCEGVSEMQIKVTNRCHFLVLLPFRPSSIRVLVKFLLRARSTPILKSLTITAHTPLSGRLFQIITTRWEKEFFLILSLANFFWIFSMFPLVPPSVSAISKKVSLFTSYGHMYIG